MALKQKRGEAYSLCPRPLIEVRKVSKTAKNREQSLADRVIDRFGGMKKMEDVTPFTYSQIYSFKRTGNIPEKDRLAILRSARAADIDLQPWIFIEHLVDVR